MSDIKYPKIGFAGGDAWGFTFKCGVCDLRMNQNGDVLSHMGPTRESTCPQALTVFEPVMTVAGLFRLIPHTLEPDNEGPRDWKDGQ